MNSHVHAATRIQSSQQANDENDMDTEIPLIRAISVICEGVCAVVHLHKQLSPPLVEEIRQALSLVHAMHFKQAVQWCVFLLISYEGEDNQIKTVRRWKSLLGLVDETDELVCLVKKQLYLVGEFSLEDFVESCIQRECFALAIQTIQSACDIEEESERKILLEKVITVQKSVL